MPFPNSGAQSLSPLQILENHYHVPLILLSSRLNKLTSFHLSLQVMFSKPFYRSFHSLCARSTESIIFLEMRCPKLDLAFTLYGSSLPLQNKSRLSSYQLHYILFGVVVYDTQTEHSQNDLLFQLCSIWRYSGQILGHHQMCSSSVQSPSAVSQKGLCRCSWFSFHKADQHGWNQTCKGYVSSFLCLKSPHFWKKKIKGGKNISWTN